MTDTLTAGRKSIKYRVKYEGIGLADYVFAESAEDAEAKARIHFEIPDDVAVTISRISEVATGHHGTSKPRTPYVPIRPAAVTS